jgi:hypothetical protein
MILLIPGEIGERGDARSVTPLGLRYGWIVRTPFCLEFNQPGFAFLNSGGSVNQAQISGYSLTWYPVDVIQAIAHQMYDA